MGLSKHKNVKRSFKPFNHSDQWQVLAYYTEAASGSFTRLIPAV